MAEPQRDHRDVVAGLQQVHGTGVPERVGCDVLGPQRRAGSGGFSDMDADAPLDRVAAERPAGAGGEQRVDGRAAPFGEPGSQHRDGGGQQRGAPFLAPFADGVHVRAGAEDDVADGEGGQLGDPQPGLGGEHDHGVVAAAGPGGLVARRGQRIDLVAGEVGDQVALEPLGRDRQHPLDGGGVLGVAQRGPGEQGPDRGEPVVAGPGAVAAVLFEVVQERGDQRGVQVGDVELAGVLAGAVGGEGQQQPPGVAVAGDGVGGWRRAGR